MHYDPIKELLGRIFNRHHLLRRMFYAILNVLLLRSWHVRRALKLSSVSLPENAHVLDAGMGFGQYSWWMARHFHDWRITAVDIKSEQVSDCNDFFLKTRISERVQAVEADLLKWNRQGSYDLILCVDVMEHIVEDTIVLYNFCNSLRPGGKLIISTPSDKGGSDVHRENDTSFIGEHVRDGYGAEEIKTMLLSCGFNGASVAYTYGLPGRIAWILSMKLPVKMISATKLSYIVLPLYYIAVMPLCLPLNALDLLVKHNEGTGLIVTAWKNI